MKYKKQIATGALALSLLVGTVYSVTKDGFTLEIKDDEAKSSADIKTSSFTAYSKNGFLASPTDLFAGEKVIVAGDFDKTANILMAKKVKIVK